MRRKTDVEIATEIQENIMECHSTWSLRLLAGYNERYETIEEISHTEIRNIVKTWNQMETVKNGIGS